MTSQAQEWDDFDSELVIGLVGATGTELDVVSRELESSLHQAGYQTHLIRISRDVIPLIQPIELQDKGKFHEIKSLMDAGNRAREVAQDNAVLASGAAFRIYEKRQTKFGVSQPNPKTAFIISSLKRQEEVERLRTIYGSGFVLLGVHSDETRRIEHLKSFDMSDSEAHYLEAIRKESSSIIERRSRSYVAVTAPRDEPSASK